MKSNHHDVRAFHEKFELPGPPHPKHLSPELARFRIAFLLEELGEFAKSVGMVDVTLQLDRVAADIRNGSTGWNDGHLNIVSAFDALLDLSVVTHGTAYLMGLPWEDGWDIVHERNMAKRRAKPDGSDSKRGSPYDVVKPPGWYGPEKGLRELLAARGMPFEFMDNEGER